MDDGVHLKQHHFRLDGSEMGAIFQGLAPSAQEDEMLETTEEPPEGFPIEDLPERPEEFAPGLTPELMDLVIAAAEMAPPSARSAADADTANGGSRRTATLTRPRTKKKSTH